MTRPPKPYPTKARNDEIARQRARGEAVAAIARQHGIHRSRVYQILNRRAERATKSN